MGGKLVTTVERLVHRANLMAKRNESSEESELFKQLAIHLDAALLAAREACKERDALVAENTALWSAISDIQNICHESDGITGYHLNGEIAKWDDVMPDLWDIKTQATDAAIAEIQAQGVDSLATFAGGEYQRFADDRAMQRKWKGIVLLCTDFAAQLRKGAAQ